MKEIYTNRKCGIELPDKTPNKRPNDSIDITIGVFFDGTGNNKYNVYFNQRAKEQFKKGYEAYIDKKGQKKYKPSKGYDSYKRGYSNVAILWEIYDTSIPYQEKVYIEGLGTEAPVGGSRYFPSSEHVNGKSIDTIYLDDKNEQIFISAMKKFGFNKQITGKNKKVFRDAIQERKGSLHNSHLHSNYNKAWIKVIMLSVLLCLIASCGQCHAFQTETISALKANSDTLLLGDKCISNKDFANQVNTTCVARSMHIGSAHNRLL